LPISDCRFPISNRQLAIGNRQLFGWADGTRTRNDCSHSAVLCQLSYSPHNLVDLTRFERVTSTFAESRSDSTELQVHHKERQKAQKSFVPFVLLCGCDKKQMKAERNNAPNTLRGTLLLRMANSRTLAKHRDRHPVEGSLPSSRKRVFRLSKNLRSGY
jgi:hypothetical protein